MQKISFLLYVLSSFFITSACENNESINSSHFLSIIETDVIPAADQLDLYLPKLENKKIGLVINHTSRVSNTHLLDTLLSLGIEVIKVFAPEHGFRGEADAGAQIKDDRDVRTGLPIISLYGAKKMPSETDLKGLDLMLFDIQDVGVRFYTYISTLHYVMEACGRDDIPLIVLDRPNPNGHYMDGPVLQKEFSSFVGMHQVPVVYGMTIGEYARMILGENWAKNADRIKLEVIPCKHYDHSIPYVLPVKPSPNLPSQLSIYRYPSTCFFEGTTLSLGRGTDFPFLWIGHPNLKGIYNFSFKPVALAGAMNPPHKDKTCYGIDLSKVTDNQIFNEASLDLKPLLELFKHFPSGDFFLKNGFFDKLAGTDRLRIQIESGVSWETIRDSWQEDLEGFKKIRAKYLIYP